MVISQIKKGKDKIDDFMDWKEDYKEFRKRLNKTKKSRDKFFEEMLEEKGIKEIQDLSDQIRKEKINNNEVKCECVEDLRKATGIMFTDRQRVTIKKRVTVREDSIWEYGLSDKAQFDKIKGKDGRTSIHIAREIRDTDARIRFMDGVDLIDDMPNLTEDICVEVENKIDNINAIEVTSDKNLKFKENCNNATQLRIPVHSLTNENRQGEMKLKEDKISYLLVYREEIVEAQKELLETMKKEKKKKQEIREKIEDLFQKELTIDEF